MYNKRFHTGTYKILIKQMQSFRNRVNRGHPEKSTQDKMVCDNSLPHKNF
jgi:hypothetical protein